MQWLEISINTSTERIDSLCSELENMGVEGFVIEDETEYKSFLETNRQYWDYVDESFVESVRGICRVKFYLPDDSDGRRQLGAIRLNFPNEDITSAIIRDEDWANNWRQYYKPVKTGKKLLIVPEWEEIPETCGREVLRLEPGLIFGTGTHPTTRMCLEALEDHVNGATILDLGCGSGILAIASLILGGNIAVGCDIDEKAPDVAMKNAELNGVNDRLTVYAGDILRDIRLQTKISSRKYDLVLANIVAGVIIPLAAAVPRWLSPNGRFICSGIIDGRESEVQAAIEENGFSVVCHRNADNWHAFEAIRKVHGSY